MGLGPQPYPGTGGGGFTLGPADNIFGSTSGDASSNPLLVTPASNRASAESVRDSYATNNPDWLPNYDLDGNQSLGILLYFLDGSDNVLQSQSRVGGEWRDRSDTVAIQGLPGSGTDFGNISDYHLPMIGPGPNKTPLDSGIARAGETGMFEAEEGMIFPRNSIQIGHAGVLSGFGALVKGLSFVTGRTFIMPFQYYDQTDGSGRTAELSFGSPSPVVRQPVFSTPTPLSGSMTLDVSSDTGNEVIFDADFRGNANDTLQGLRIRLTVQGQTEPFFYFPTRAGYDSGSGRDIVADGDGFYRLDLSDAPLFLLEDPTVLIEYEADGGSLLGDGSTPYLSFDLSEVTINNLARDEDIAHPVTLRRDMPSEEDAQALADSSLNGNSALWIVANDQLVTSNRADATIVAQQAGVLDLDGNEIPTMPVAANTIQMRSGTICRVFDGNEFRAVSSHLLMSDVSQEIVFVFDDLTINNANLDAYNRKTLICNFTGLSNTITIAQNTDIDYFDVFVGESAALLVATQGLERINDEVDKRFASNQGGRIKKMTQGGQYGIVYSASNDLANSGSQSPHPVEVGRDFRFSEGEISFSGTVFQTLNNVQAIAFSGGELDIPNIDGDAFHVVGDYIVLQYFAGLVFARITSSTSTGGAGDVEARVVGSIAFTDGKDFTPPNVENNIHIGVMKSELDPDTEVAFESVRSNSGSLLGADFHHPAYTDTREIVFTLQNADEATYTVNSLFIVNNTALGPASGAPSDAGVITSAVVNPNNNLQVIVDLATPITVGANSGSAALLELYDVTSETVRHVIVEGGANAEVDNGTLRLLPASSGNGVSYTDGGGANNELVAKTGNDDEAKGSGITLNSLGRIPFENIGEADITLSGTGGSLTVDVNNIDQYKNRTIFVNHSNTFTVNLDSIDDFHDESSGPFFLRFVQISDRVLAVQGPVTETIGGRSQYRIPQNGSLTIELPVAGQLNWPVLAAGNPLRRFDIIQITSSQLYDDDAKLERICDHLLEVDGANVSLTFESSSLDCAFWVHNQGASDVSLSGAGGASMSGYATIQPGELVWVWNTASDSTYRSVKLADSNEEIPVFLPNNYPIVDSLATKVSGKPTSNSEEMIIFAPNWVGSRPMRVDIGGVVISLGNVSSAVKGKIITERYTITNSNWDFIYLNTPTSITAAVQVEIDSLWETIYQIDVTV